jgi:hypothetical protein
LLLLVIVALTYRLSRFSSSAVGNPPTKTAAEGPGCGSAAETRSITCQVSSKQHEQDG